MDITIKHGPLAKLKSACVVAAVFSGKSMGEYASALDRAQRGALSKLVKRGDISGKAGEALMVPATSGIGAERVLLIGVGKRGAIKPADYVKLVKKAAATVGAAKLRAALLIPSRTGSGMTTP